MLSKLIRPALPARIPDMPSRGYPQRWRRLGDRRPLLQLHETAWVMWVLFWLVFWVYTSWMAVCGPYHGSSSRGLALGLLDWTIAADEMAHLEDGGALREVGGSWTIHPDQLVVITVTRAHATVDGERFNLSDDARWLARARRSSGELIFLIRPAPEATYADVVAVIDLIIQVEDATGMRVLLFMVEHGSDEPDSGNQAFWVIP